MFRKFTTNFLAHPSSDGQAKCTAPRWAIHTRSPMRLRHPGEHAFLANVLVPAIPGHGPQCEGMLSGHPDDLNH
jgi:hypothetical protein